MSGPSQTIAGIKDSFSSWDKCMSKPYCKWPVIVAIVVGSLIVLSIIICVVRCACCGYRCACCCFKCCCCGESRGHKPKNLAGPGQGRPIYNQYQSTAPPVYGANNPYGQTATFESKVHEDSLPAMPSWETAASKKIEVVEDVPKDDNAHELDRLNPKASGSSPALSGFAAPTPTRPGQPSMPHSPYSESPYNETTSFLRAQSPAMRAHSPGLVGHGDSHSGYRGAAPDPGSIGIGYANRSPTNPLHSPQTFNTASEYGSNTQFNNYTGQGGGYGGGGDAGPRYHDQRPDYARQPSAGSGVQRYSPHRISPPGGSGSPMYGGSPAQQSPPDRYQAYSPVQRPPQGQRYGQGQGYGQQRGGSNGTWKDV